MIDRGFFQSEGYLILRQWIPRAPLTQVIHDFESWAKKNDAFDPKNLRFRFKNQKDTGALELDAVDPVLDLFPSVGKISELPSLIELLENLLDDKVSLFKDKLIVKYPGVEGYPLHQDFISWPNFPKSFTTVVVPLDSTTRENGCIELFPRVHHRGYLSESDGDFHDLTEIQMKGSEAVPLILEPGDIVVFGALVPHRSGPNATEYPRRQLYLSYNRTSELGNFRTQHYQFYRDWLSRRYGEFGGKAFYFK